MFKDRYLKVTLDKTEAAKDDVKTNFYENLAPEKIVSIIKGEARQIILVGLAIYAAKSAIDTTSEVVKIKAAK